MSDDQTLTKAHLIFSQAMEVSPDDRHTFIERACQGQTDLLAEVHKLLASRDDGVDSQKSDPLELPWTVSLAPSGQTGSSIGTYKLLQQIGEGGFGMVYMAEQFHPVRRKVALKIIKPGMDTREVVGRFEAERQALAMMDHPNIAKVLDGGSTESGHPYFVMELVKGIPLTQFCDKQRINLRQRLQLFVSVCKAIQHAHQKGVIHRDIKPSNVLVTLHDGVPIAKVIDFGIAKAITHQLTNKTLYTAFGQMIGTPQYMSPEQAEMSGLDIDTRSDVYSLGVLLYELLTGTTPLQSRELRDQRPRDVQRMICEVDTPKPSSRLSALGNDLSAIAAARDTEPKRMGAMVRGDLDWIVMKALEKQRDRRYSTASGLAEDVERFLRNEPVEACPPSVLYTVRKFAKRHKSLIALATAMGSVLLLMTAVSISQAVRAQREANRANVLLSQLRDSAPAFLSEARALVSDERFDDALAKIDYALKLIPDDPEFWLMKGNLLESTFRFAEARDAYRTVLTIDAGHERALANLQICEDLAELNHDDPKKYAPDDLQPLLHLMIEEHRSGAEFLPVASLIMDFGKTVRLVWLERLKSLPLGPGPTLEERLNVLPNGKLHLDLSETLVTDRDLIQLMDMPLSYLDLHGCERVKRLEPLLGMPLTYFNLGPYDHSDSAEIISSMTELEHLIVSNVRITSLKGFASLKKLSVLELNTCPIQDLSPLRGIKLDSLTLSGVSVTDLSVLKDMPLSYLVLQNLPATDFSVIGNLPLETLYLEGVAIGDLSVLQKLPLKQLYLWRLDQARNFAAINKIESLEILLLPETVDALAENELMAIDALANHPRMRLVTNRLAGVNTSTTEYVIESRDDFLRRWQSMRREDATVDQATVLLRDEKYDEAVAIHRERFDRYLAGTGPNLIRLHDAVQQLKTWTPPQDKPSTEGLVLDGRMDYALIPSLYFNGQAPVTLEIVFSARTLHRYPGYSALISTAHFGGISLDVTTEGVLMGVATRGHRVPETQVWEHSYDVCRAKFTPAIGQRYHVAAVWDHDALRVYVDGKLTGELLGKVTCTALTSFPFCIGCDPFMEADNPVEGRMNGTIEQVRISAAADYLADFTPPATLEDRAGTVARFDFRQESGPFAEDLSGHGNHAVMMRNASE